MDGLQITCWLVVALCSLGCIYLAWEFHAAPLLDENERPVTPRVPKPRDPVDVIAFHSPAKDRIAARIAANEAARFDADAADWRQS